MNDEKVINGYAFVIDSILVIGFGEIQALPTLSTWSHSLFQSPGFIGGVLIPQITGTFHRGFFCNDQSIQYPYKEDTITPAVLLLYALLVMIITVINVLTLANVD